MSTTKVWPLTEAGAQLRHPHSHMTFKPAESGMTIDPVEWPSDQFTFRRIQDGDITDKAPDASKAREQDSPENSEGEKANPAKRRNLA